MSALPRHVALVSKSKSVGFSEISSVAAALNKQVGRDFGPSWGISATVDGFDKLQDVPVDYWPVIILDKLDDPSAGGYHQTKNGEPFSVVLASEFPIAASHETLEMLADPFGRRTIAGSPPPNSPAPINGFSRVMYLVEVCDPCEGQQFVYQVNGISVSDFITPNYYDPVTSTTVRYSFTGAITAPHQVLEAGYISFSDPASGRWYQIFVQHGKVVSQQLPANDFRSMPIREATDDAARKFRAKHPPKKVGKKPGKKAGTAALAAMTAGRVAAIEEALEKL
jgi:hypothetical protein